MPDSNSFDYAKIIASIYFPSRREFVKLVTKQFCSITSTLTVDVKKVSCSQNSIPKPDSSSFKCSKILPSIYWLSRRDFVALMTKHFCSITKLRIKKYSKICKFWRMYRCLRLVLSLLYESLRRKLRLTVYRRL